mgnify:CR=1 FL=1
MAEVKKVSPASMSLAVCIVLVVILGIASVWLYMRTDSLQKQVNALETDKNNLQGQVNSLQTDKTDLETQVDNLKAPQLHQVNIAWSDYHPWFSSAYISCSGTIFNSGTETSSNVKITVRIYNSAETLLKSEVILLGEIEGKSYKNFSDDIAYAGDADHITTEVTSG